MTQIIFDCIWEQWEENFILISLWFFHSRRKKITVRDFEPLSIIGRGAFGEVRICRVKTTGDVVAMKKMKKSEMVFKNQVAHVKAEREVLVRAKNAWIVDLKFSF